MIIILLFIMGGWMDLRFPLCLGICGSSCPDGGSSTPFSCLATARNLKKTKWAKLKQNKSAGVHRQTF